MNGLLKEHGSTGLVAALSACFGVGLLSAIGTMSDLLDPLGAEHGSVKAFLLLVGVTFLVIAVYVGAVVTANTVATIVAGRVRRIALLRLLGSTARAERIRIAREGLVVGIVGALIGAVAGDLLGFALQRAMVGVWDATDYGYTWWRWEFALPVVAVVLTTWLAAWVGSRRVLSVTPLQALRGAEELGREDLVRRPKRNAGAAVLFIVGGGLLILAALLGLLTPLAVLIGIVGGVISFTGVVLGADLVLPWALRITGRLFGRSAAAKLAAENAVRSPQRSARSTVGLVIGVTLLTMFAVGGETFRAIAHTEAAAHPDEYQGIDQLLNTLLGIFSVLVGFSAVIAGVGLVSALSLSVLQRTRELGLLRALGFTAEQVRRMILAEGAQLTFTAVVLGVVLGGLYGWAGAQSLLGAATGSPGIVWPAVPWVELAVIGVAAAALTVAATWPPSRQASRLSPVSALAVE